ncbi:hypothetical protein INS49_010291 [Diaporthe citri]|uniref:uncharacterized protein n=1 Tax=Diaporthe citri TaxID=83186 RepID=UPI001C7F9F57|nr:uncharacterized protein INS49_010291 [Diaporthe citri]KAG6362062.1 hypothetical protein INS49_010291 [Diaporthe citri]
MNNANHDNREYINLDPLHEDDDDNDRSPIELRIMTTVQVEGDNNAILLTASPAEHARAIAEAVTATIRQAGGVDGGIPMIDEEGRPRPFKIYVAAGMNIEGSGNVLGNADHVLLFLSRKRKRDDNGGNEDGDGDGAVADKGGDGAAAPPPPRRPRRSSF